MRTILTNIMINANIEKVWATLIDFQSYPIWNSFIPKIEGTAKEGEKISITIHPPHKKPMIFTPTILSISKYQFSWLGKAWGNVFCGEHHFSLQPITEQKVEFIHSEVFSGLLHIPIFALIHQSTKAGFNQMNSALKKHCEEST